MRCVAAHGALLALAGLAMTAVPVAAQQHGRHYLHAGVLEPGAIGRQHLLRGGPSTGALQPVEIKAPQGALVSLAAGNDFDPPQGGRLVGLGLGQVYRLRVINIPLQPGEEVFPTVEIIDRVHPPAGRELRFPIPIELTQEDLELALAGRFVVRVVYIENPDTAVPAAQIGQQHWFDVPASADPLAEADRLGRPVAIVRLGGRIPSLEGPDSEFLYGSPPWVGFDIGRENAAHGR
jgi:hypothetical protein